jgi:hypothetical protein
MSYPVRSIRSILRPAIAGAVIASGAMLFAAQPAAAHHSFAAEFDIHQPIKLTGEVTRMVFTNPHSYIYLRVTTDSGEVQDWAIEGGAPNALIRRGWNRNSLPPGTVVTVLGYRAREGGFRASGASVTLPDGSSLSVGSTGVGAPSEK